MSRGAHSNGNGNGNGNGNNRLSIIAEDENQVPVSASNPKLIRTSNRSHHRRWSDQPPRHSFEVSPPKYDVFNENQRKRRFFSWTNSPQITKRGGWKRLLILALILTAIVIALAIGLGVGLTHQNNSSASASASTSTPSPVPRPFPIGAYAINTFLTTVLTSCTANPATFSCYPYATYNTSQASAAATFNWIISSPTNSASNLTISTSNNPFANTFSGVPLTLQNKGQPDEHYAFSTTLQKIVVPNKTISADGAAANCYYNTTTFAGAMYTKMPYSSAAPPTPSGSSGSGSMSSEGNSDWQPWPYAVNVTQSVHGGQGVPECYEFTNDGKQGPLIGGIAAQASDTMCECQWLNFDL